ncbi:hypothetical protein [Deinococcus planocerae]|uniref:hypothetical protein n=1 Tax=Deinococcus planocerae TaxID=1737569 RepID=UPI000C7F00E7|nr:hypothetical protein [Deinococcus planocerae]
MLAAALGAALLAPVSHEAVQVVQGRAFVSCPWLHQHREDLSCLVTPSTLALGDAYSPTVVWLIDRTSGEASSHLTSTDTVRRPVTPPRATPTNVFLAARDLQALLGVKVVWQAGQLFLGPTLGAERAAANTTPADRAAAELRRQRVLPADLFPTGDGERLTLFPVGRADERCDWVEREVRCSAWREDHWQETWAARVGRTSWDVWPTPAGGALDAVLEAVVTVRGEEPRWPGSVEYEGVSGSGFGHAVRRGRVAPDGRWTPVYEKRGTIDDAFAPRVPPPVAKP